MAVLDERAERADAGVGLAGGDAHRGRVRQAAVAVEVVGGERLLEPVEIETFDVAQQLEGLLDRVRAAAVDHESPGRPERRSRCLDQLDVSFQAPPERAPAELERPVAGERRPFRDPAYLGGRRGHDLAGVDRHLVQAAPAEQVGDRSACGLAGDVPERHVDCRDDVQRRTATAVVVGAVEHHLPHPVDLQGVLADDQLADATGDRVRRRHLHDRPRDVRRRVRLADADDALVGVHLDEEGVLRPVGTACVDLVQTEHNGLDIGDLHGVRPFMFRYCNMKDLTPVEASG